jgi:hypothetical protein
MSITLPMSLVSALSGLVLTVADAPPKFNAAAGCKAAAAIDQSMDLSVSQSYDSCMKDEESARQQLVQTWSKYTPQDKSRCVGGDSPRSPSKRTTVNGEQLRSFNWMLPNALNSSRS